MPINPIDGCGKDDKPFAADSGEKELFLAKYPNASNESVQNEEKWVALCAQAAVEQDPKKLLELVSEINRLLDHRRKRLLNGTD